MDENISQNAKRTQQKSRQNVSEAVESHVLTLEDYLKKTSEESENLLPSEAEERVITGREKHKDLENNENHGHDRRKKPIKTEEKLVLEEIKSPIESSSEEIGHTEKIELSNDNISLLQKNLFQAISPAISHDLVPKVHKSPVSEAKVQENSFYEAKTQENPYFKPKIQEKYDKPKTFELPEPPGPPKVLTPTKISSNPEVHPENLESNSFTDLPKSQEIPKPKPSIQKKPKPKPSDKQKPTLNLLPHPKTPETHNQSCQTDQIEKSYKSQLKHYKQIISTQSKELESLRKQLLTKTQDFQSLLSNSNQNLSKIEKLSKELEQQKDLVKKSYDLANSKDFVIAELKEKIDVISNKTYEFAGKKSGFSDADFWKIDEHERSKGEIFTFKDLTKGKSLWVNHLEEKNFALDFVEKIRGSLPGSPKSKYDARSYKSRGKHKMVRKSLEPITPLSSHKGN